ncbi:hypothetical protein DY000_02044033 [Brassica cretica]|uniref:Uncharacterized protein n=1 Tax=Brassica cretica TaxID=69181 RepID=A0ABQ7B4L4_BRACR|nr:hypothetical protein DY000_02044033 [Brassica cretica]
MLDKFSLGNEVLSRQKNPKKESPLLICCSDGRCFSPPPGTVPLRLSIRRLSLNCGISTSIRRGFRSGLGRVTTYILWPAIGWKTKGWWPHRLLYDGREPVRRNPASVKSDVQASFQGSPDCFERLSGLLITFSPCLRYFFSFESVLWCAVCRSKPALMWVATSSIRFGEIFFTSVFIVPSVRISLPSSMVLTSIVCGVMLFTGIRMGCVVPWFLTDWFSGFLGKELWSFSSIEIGL